MRVSSSERRPIASSCLAIFALFAFFSLALRTLCGRQQLGARRIVQGNHVLFKVDRLVYHTLWVVLATASWAAWVVSKQLVVTELTDLE